jgi:hypothetical protein
MTANPEFDRQLEENRRAYAALREEIRAKYAGRFVALAFGRVAADGATVREVMAAVERLVPRPLHVEVFPAEAEPLFDELLSPSAEYF